MKYFLDTNVISKFIDKDSKAIDILTPILEDSESILYINRLVEMESLRAIPKNRVRLFNTTKEILDSFEKLEITQDIYKKAIDFARFCKSKGLNIKGKCAAIDYIHFMTAKEYDLEIISFDNDMKKLQEKYEEFINQ